MFIVPGICDYSVIGVVLSTDGAVLLGARYEDRAAGSWDQFHCGAMVNGTTSYWAQLKVSENNVKVMDSGMYSGNVTRIYGYMRRG